MLTKLQTQVIHANTLIPVSEKKNRIEQAARRSSFKYSYFTADASINNLHAGYV